MWILILIAVHTTNTSDQPGRIELKFMNEHTCEQTLKTMKWKLKFNNFKIEGICEKQS